MPSLLVRSQLIAVVSLALAPLADAASFTPLGDLAGGSFKSNALDVSAAGSVVVGNATADGDSDAFRWTAATGMQRVVANNFSTGRGVSDDGSTSVGQLAQSFQFFGFRAVDGGSLLSVGDLPGGLNTSDAEAASADGSVVVGKSRSTPGQEAYRWTPGGGIQGLGDLPGGAFDSGARDLSSDGSVVVGFGASSSGTEAFRWTAGDGMQGLGDLPGGAFSSIAESVSADGSVVVGRASTVDGLEAFLWNAADGMQGLGTLPGSNRFSLATGVSGDGTRVVGGSSGAAFIWDAQAGIRSVQTVLADAGVDLTNWNLATAAAISADGTTGVGTASNPSGNEEAFLATLAAQPACDFSGDGAVYNDDLNLLLTNWGAPVLPLPTGWEGTPPAGAAVDNDELNDLLNNWGAGAAVSVPEPTSGMLLVLIATAARRRRRNT